MNNLLWINSKHLSSLDSLHFVISKLNHKVDSLQSLMSRYTVSTDYYHDILTSQVTIFVGIVTAVVALLGLVSWGIIALPFRRKEKAIYEKIENLKSEISNPIFEQLVEFGKRIDQQEKSNDANTNRAIRTFYYINNQLNYHDYAFKLALQVAVGYSKDKKEQEVQDWLALADESLSKVQSAEYLKEMRDENIESLTIIKKVENQDALELATAIEEKMLKFIYGRREN